jgi:hypothetical protein
MALWPKVVLVLLVVTTTGLLVALLRLVLVALKIPAVLAAIRVVVGRRAAVVAALPVASQA